MERYYSSYYVKFQNEITEAQFLSQGFAYRHLHSEKHLFKVVESLNKEKNILLVYYYSDELTDELKIFHTNNYPHLSLGICKNLNSGIQVIYYNNCFELKSMNIEIYFEDGRSRLSQEFNEKYELVEYRERIYNDNNKQIIEKIFFANSWVIHEEDL